MNKNLKIYIKVSSIFLLISFIFLILLNPVRAECPVGECLINTDCKALTHITNNSIGDVLGASIKIFFYYPDINSTFYNSSTMIEINNGQYYAFVRPTVLGRHKSYWNTSNQYCNNCSEVCLFDVVNTLINTSIQNISDTSNRIETNTIDTKNILFNGTLQKLIWTYTESRNVSIDWKTGGLYIWNSTDRNLTFTADVTNYPAIQTWVWNYTSKTLNIWNETSEDLLYQCLKESNCAGWWINNTLTGMNNTLNSWNNAITKSNIQIYGTEYEPLENASIFAQVLNSTGAFTNSSCNITMFYENQTFFVNDSLMRFIPNSRSIYKYNFIVPNLTGDMAVQVYCANPVVAEGISKIHVAPWAQLIHIINSTRMDELKNLFGCSTVPGYSNTVCDRLNKIIDTANDTLFYAKLSVPKYLMNIYKIDSTEIGYLYAYRLELNHRGDYDPTIWLKVSVNSSSDIILRNDNFDVTSFSLTQDATGDYWIHFKSTGLLCDKSNLDSHLDCGFKNYYVYLRNPLYLRNNTIADLKPQSYLDLTLEKFSTAEKKLIPDYDFKGYLILSLSIIGIIIILMSIIFGIMFLFFWTFEERLAIKKKLVRWKYRKKYLKDEEEETE